MVGSGGGRLVVAGPTLAGLAGHLDAVVGLLAGDVSARAGHERDLGEGVAGAVERFERHWGDGRARLRRDAATFAAALHDGLDAYTRADTDLAGALTPSGVVAVRGRGGPV
ncbi:hypothetical protein [Cellulomonas hominis]